MTIGSRLLGRWSLATVLFISSAASALGQWGGVDPSFTPGGGNNAGLDNDVFSIAIQPDGKLVVAGAFTKVDRTSRNSLARLNSNGILDTTFDPGAGANHTIEVATLQADGKVLVCGRFTAFDNQPRSYIARVNTNGVLDTAFSPVIDSLVLVMALQADGRIVIGGAFTSVNGTPRNYVARLYPDGSLDASFDPGPGPDRPVHALALAGNGKVVIGGQFTSVNGVARVRLARLFEDGSLDNAFDPGAGANLTVTSLAMQADGRVIAGGDFTSIGGTAQNYVARLTLDGSRDASFNPNIALSLGAVITVHAEADGKVLVGGEFETIDGVARKNVARLNANGSVDTSFDPGAGPSHPVWFPRIRGFAIQPDGKVIVGGAFTTFSGARLNYIARLLGDQGGTVEFADAIFSVNESDGSAAVTVRRSGTTAGSVSVNLATRNGTASAGSDYLSVSGVLVFNAGETNGSFSISILPDSLLEGNETVNLILGNPIGGIILGAQKTAVLTILDSTNAVPPLFTSIAPVSGDRLRLTLSAQAGRSYMLEGSTNFNGWTALKTNVATGSSVEFVEDAAGPRRFYRAVAK